MNDTTTEHLCPRRAEGGPPFPGPDRWDGRGGLNGQADIGLSCSYCGSLNPDTFMQLVRDGWEVGPTDKNYKSYVGRPLTEDELNARKTGWTAGDVGRAVRATAINDGKTPDEADAAVEEYWRTHEVPIRGTAKTVAKFYFQHLDQAQRDEFIELYNSKAMALGYPGRFYVAPYFCRDSGERVA